MNNINKNEKTLTKIIDEIAKESSLLDFLDKNNIAEIDQIMDIEHYQRNNYRNGLILTVKEKGADEMTKILIDLRHGLPTIKQVYDALYDIGKDCDIKIIVYSNGVNGYDKFNPANDEYAVLSLIARLQADNVPIALFQINGVTSEMKYVDLYQNWYLVDQSKSIEIPTREQFMAETFWAVYFDSFNEGFYTPWETYCGEFRAINDWGHLIHIDCSVSGEIKLYWDQKGVRFVVKPNYYSKDALQKDLDTDILWLKDRYGTDSIEMKKEFDRTPSLIIKYSDRPFNWLYAANPEQILEFAKSMHEDAWNLRWRLEETIDGQYEAQSV
jgi:hypothetical protein